jgi:hypothetical protein
VYPDGTPAGAQRSCPPTGLNGEQPASKSPSPPRCTTSTRGNNVRAVEVGEPCVARSKSPAHSPAFQHCPARSAPSGAGPSLATPRPWLSLNGASRVPRPPPCPCRRDPRRGRAGTARERTLRPESPRGGSGGRDARERHRGIKERGRRGRRRAILGIGGKGATHQNRAGRVAALPLTRSTGRIGACLVPKRRALAARFAEIPSKEIPSKEMSTLSSDLDDNPVFVDARAFVLVA